MWPIADKDWVAMVCDSRLAQAYRRVFSTIHRFFPNRQFEKLFLPQPGHSGLFKLPRLIIKALQRQRAQKKSLLDVILVQSSDVILMADASWQIPNWDCVHSAQAKGAWVGNVIYDLIPLTHPEFFARDLVERFEQWFDKAIRTSDFFVCISDHVAQQVRERLVSLGVDWNLAQNICLSFPMGADIDVSENCEVALNDLTCYFAEKRENNPHLVVGTLEPRKNHCFILDSFDQLWNKGSNEKLCLIGRVGWNCDKLLERIRNHPEFTRKLFVAHTASDADIAFAYRHAKSVITASHTEGFGLPIIEGLQFDQIVLASDTGVHREVGGAHARYFRIDGACNELAQEIMQVDKLREHRSIYPICFQAVHWDESYRTLVSRIDQIVDFRSAQRKLLAA